MRQLKMEEGYDLYLASKRGKLEEAGLFIKADYIVDPSTSIRRFLYTTIIFTILFTIWRFREAEKIGWTK